MSASRVLSAKLFEPTTTVPASALSPASGLSEVPSESEEQPASSAAAAVSATAAAPVCLVLDLLLFAVKFIRRSKRSACR